MYILPIFDTSHSISQFFLQENDEVFYTFSYFLCLILRQTHSNSQLLGQKTLLSTLEMMCFFLHI